MLRQIKQLVETSRLTTIGKAQALETAMVGQNTPSDLKLISGTTRKV